MKTFQQQMMSTPATGVKGLTDDVADRLNDQKTNLNPSWISRDGAAYVVIWPAVLLRASAAVGLAVPEKTTDAGYDRFV
jgi:hypothetical protein